MRRTALMPLAMVIAFAGACFGPTEVDLVLTTNVDCRSLPMETAIFAGAPNVSQVAAPNSVTSTCVAEEPRIGTLTLVPSGGRNAHFTIEVVAGVGVPVSTCVGAGLAKCILARRSAGFMAHEVRTLPIFLSAGCIGVPCGADQTCDRGNCTPLTACDEHGCPSDREVADAGSEAGSDGGPEASDGGGDATADADASGEAGGCPGATGCVRHVFVTSVTYLPADIMSPSVADGLCNGLVNGGMGPLKGRRFQAWLSATGAGNAAADRLVHGTKQYVSADEVSVLADNWTALTSGTLKHGITQDETGALLPAVAVLAVWTGTGPDGTAASPNCGDWKSNDPDNNGVTGTVGATTATWTDSGPLPCNLAHHLLCVEE